MGSAGSKAAAGVSDLVGSVGNMSSGDWASALLTGGILPLAQATRNDMRNQAEGRADKQIQQAQLAEAHAKDVAVKELDPLALARRARAELSTANGRQSTILTNSQQLGTGDPYHKQLLGL